MMCSYQTLARYHDDGFSSGQASRIRKSLEDIRLDHRHAIYQARLKLKSSKMLKNRRIFTELLESDSSDEETYYDNDAVQTTPPSAFSSRLEDRVDRSSFSAWELSSQSSNYPSPSSEQDILAYFTETSPSPACSSTSSSQTSKKVHQPFRTLKELNRASTSPPKPRCTLDATKTRQEFDALKDFVLKHPSTSDTLSLHIHNNYQALLHPLRTFSTDDLPQVLELISSLIVNESLKPETLLMILQQGLMMQISNIFSRQDPTCDQEIVALINTVVETYPAAVPFMIDSMTTSNFWSQLKTELQLDNMDNVLPRLQVYHKLTSYALSQLLAREQIQPLLPPVLLQTGVTDQTLESYNSLNTLGKLFSTPEILILIREHCLESSYYNRPNLVTTVLQIFAITLQYICVVSSLEPSVQESSNILQIAKLLNALKGSDICLVTVISSLNRTISTSQHSEHSSQGVGTNASSSTSLNHCQQFLTYFSQYYTPLQIKYQDVMERLSDSVTTRLYKPLDL